MEYYTNEEIARMTDKDRKRLEEAMGGPLSPYDFERGIALLWSDLGYETEVTQASQDGGIDILAHGPDGTVAIQAKQYSDDNRVGVREVREYAALKLRPEIDYVVIVTTSSFTSQAVKEAQLLRVRLIDGEELLSLCRKHIRVPKLLDETCTGISSGTPSSDHSLSIKKPKYEWDLDKAIASERQFLKERGLSSQKYPERPKLSDKPVRSLLPMPSGCLVAIAAVLVLIVIVAIAERDWTLIPGGIVILGIAIALVSK